VTINQGFPFTFLLTVHGAADPPCRRVQRYRISIALLRITYLRVPALMFTERKEKNRPNRKDYRERLVNWDISGSSRPLKNTAVGS